MTCCNGARTNDRLSFLLEMVCLLLLRSNSIICEYIIKNGFLSGRFFPSGNFFLSLDDLPVKSLTFVSMVFSTTNEGSRPAEIR